MVRLYRLLCSFVLLHLVILSKAQIPDSTKLIYPSFRLQRAMEDYSFLSQKTGEWNFWERLKYVQLGKHQSLSFGADARAEFQVLQNEDWEDGNNDQALFLRLMLHSDWWWRKKVRLFIQWKSGHTFGRNGPNLPFDVDRLDIHQLFTAFKIGESILEIGRRELSYGSRRLISIREGTNIRQSFDGLRWIWERPQHRLDLLFYAYNPQQTGILDNRFNTDQLLWGIYQVWKKGEAGQLNFDIYYLGVRNENTSFEEGSTLETRHSIGVRHWGKIGALEYNNEGLWQWGRFGQGQISAWTFSSELYYHFDGEKAFKPGLKLEIISGDREAGDGNLQTFNALYPRGGYFGLLAVVGPANLIDIHPSLSFELFPSLSLNLDWDFFWRHRIGDGIYFPSGRLNLPGSSSTKAFIGHQLGMQVEIPFNRFLAVEASYFYFVSGSFLKEVSDGNNFSQLGVSLSFKF